MLTSLTILTMFTIINTNSTNNFYTICYSQHTVPNLTLQNNTRKKKRFDFGNKRTKLILQDTIRLRNMETCRQKDRTGCPVYKGVSSLPETPN